MKGRVWYVIGIDVIKYKFDVLYDKMYEFNVIFFFLDYVIDVVFGWICCGIW